MREKKPLVVILINSLFVWSLSSHSWIVHTYWDVTIAGEGLQILTYARHSWPLNSEGSLTCHTHCDTCLPHTRDTHTCCRAVPTCFYDLGLSRPGIEPRSPAYEASGLSLRHRGVIINYSEIYSKKKTRERHPDS